MITSSVERTVQELQSVLSENLPLEKLQKDIDSFSNLREEMKIKSTTGRELVNLLNSYIQSLSENIRNRLGSNPTVIEAYSVFDLAGVPHLTDENIQDYGHNEIMTLADHFYTDSAERKMKLVSQWTQTKYYIRNKKLKEYPMKDTEKCTFLWSIF